MQLPSRPIRFPRRPFGLVEPFDIDQRMDLLEQLAKVDRFHQRVVVQTLGVQHVMRVDGVGRQHEDRCAFARLAAQTLRDFPAVHLRHGDVEQDEVRIDLLDNLQTLAAGCRGHHHKTKRLKQIADQFALDLVVVDHEYRLPRAGIALHVVFHRGRNTRARHLR